MQRGGCRSELELRLAGVRAVRGALPSPRLAPLRATPPLAGEGSRSGTWTPLEWARGAGQRGLRSASFPRAGLPPTGQFLRQR